MKKIKTTLKISKRSKHKIQFDMYIMIRELELLILNTYQLDIARKLFAEKSL